MDSSIENSRASWRDPELDKCFLEQCIEEVTRAGRLGTSLRPESWTRVRDVIKEKFNIPFHQRQMKNRYDYLKEKYQEWVALKNKTGNLYNPITNSFNMSKDEWDEYIKTHPKAKTLKTSNLPFPDLCSSLFDGAAATGMKGWGPASEKSRPNSGSSASAVSLELCHIEDDFNDNEDHTQENQELPRKNGPRSNATQSSSAEKSSKKKKQNQFDLDEKMGKALDILIRKNSGPSVEDCVERFYSLGWSDTHPLFLCAMGVFCDKQSFRDAWMKLPTQRIELLEGWIKQAGKTLGFEF